MHHSGSFQFEFSDPEKDRLIAENQELKREIHVWHVLVTTCMLQDFWERGVRGADMTHEKLREYMQSRMSISYETGSFGEYEGINSDDDDTGMIAMEKTVNRICRELGIPEFEIGEVQP